MLRSTAGQALKNIPPAYLLFATLFLIFVGTLMPGQMKNDAHVLLGQHLPWPALAHLVLFGVLVSLPVYGAGWRGSWRALGLALVAAVATELLQGLVPGRHPMLRDVGIDLGGRCGGAGDVVEGLGLRRG